MLCKIPLSDGNNGDENCDPTCAAKFGGKNRADGGNGDFRLILLSLILVVLGSNIGRNPTLLKQDIIHHDE